MFVKIITTATELMKTFKLVTKVSDQNEILHKDVIIIDIPVLLVPINIIYLYLKAH